MQTITGKIQIVFIITDLDTGGAEIILFRTLQQINRAIFDCQVISLTSKGNIGDKISSLNIPVKSLGMKPGRFDLLLLIKLIAWLVKLKPTLVQTWMYHADLLGGLAAWFAGIPVIWNIHNATFHPQGNRTTWYVLKICAFLSYLIPARIISVSQKASENHIKWGYQASKFEVIPNGFDIKVFQPDNQAKNALKEELGLNSTNLIAGCVARFDPQKDHLTLVQAARTILSEYPETRFVLCGDNINWNNNILKDWINKAGISSSVYLLGRRDDIPKIMAGLDLLVSSSVGEAFPSVLGEAMACGTPCVATDVGDSGLIIGDTGFLVAPGSPKALAEGIRKMIKLSASERQTLGLNARKRIMAYFNLPDIVLRYEVLYQKILGRL